MCAAHICESPGGAGQVANQITRNKPNHKPFDLTERQRRALTALWKAPGWIGREAIDKIARASNGPEVIRQLRVTHGIDIEMRRESVLDYDGNSSNPGRYRLSDAGRSYILDRTGKAGVLHE